VTKHEEKYCPRCREAFECKVGSILLCQCSEIRLNYEELEYLKSQYEDCLGANCMKELKAEYHNELYHSKLKRILGEAYKRPLK